jgi:hypothetical protein
MALTKQELIKKLPKYIMLGHGLYDANPSYIIVPEKTVFIFLSRASRYLPQSVITRKFYRFFGTPDRDYSIRHSDDMPDVVKGWYTHTYGPGQRMSDINLAFYDPWWPGMGLHKLPISPDQFKTTPGKFQGQGGKLSQLLPLIGPGVYFITSCRAITGQHKSYMSIFPNYFFNPGPHRNRQIENDVSKNLSKRKRNTTMNNLTRRLENFTVTSRQPRRILRVVRTPIENITSRMSRVRLGSPPPVLVNRTVSRMRNVKRRKT